jgi:PAS domain S-box-containing protein
VYVKEIMTRNVITISEEATVGEAVQVIREHKIKGIPVVDETGRVCGMFTLKHLHQIIEGKSTLDVPVKELMHRKVTVIRDDMPLDATCASPQKRLPVMDEYGNLVGILTKSDIIRGFKTTYIQAKQELKAVLEATPHGIVAVDRRGYITFINPAAEKILRLSASKVVGGDILDFIPGCAVTNVLASGVPMRNFKNTINGITYIAQAAPIIDGQEIIGAVASFQPVSDIENIANELSVVKQLYKEVDAVISSSYDGILVSNEHGVIQKVNAATIKLLGINPSDALGRPADEVARSHWLGESVTARVIKERKPFSASYKVNGKTIVLTGNPVFDENGNVVRVVINVRDLGELSTLKQELEEVNRLKEMYYSELSRLKAEVASSTSTFRSSEMQRVYDLALRVAVVDTPILIQGESGVGKEVLANYVHENSLRRNGPFIKINCAAIPENLLESELFGYAEGAFTGAKKGGKPGVFELANRGTLFLDEIGELPSNIQAKLLRALQDQEVFKVGGSRAVKFDARLLFATNRNLEDEVRAGRFREDLFYRINIVPITVPPLRDRADDIAILIVYFLTKLNEKYSCDKRIPVEVVEVLSAYSWPGNVRELVNVLERMIITSQGEIIGLEDVPRNIIQHTAQSLQSRRGIVLPLKNVLEMVERDVIEQSLKSYRSLRQAAKALCIDPSTLLRKAEKYNLKTGIALAQQLSYNRNEENP